MNAKPYINLIQEAILYTCYLTTVVSIIIPNYDTSFNPWVNFVG